MNIEVFVLQAAGQIKDPCKNSMFLVQCRLEPKDDSEELPA